MPIDFHSEQNQATYTNRHANDSWKQAVKQLIEVNGKKAVGNQKNI